MSKAKHSSEQESMALPIRDYIGFLRDLIGTGGNLPLAMGKFQDGVSHFKAGLDDFEEGAQLLTGKAPPSAMLALGGTMEITPEIAQVEQEFLAKLREGQHGHTFAVIGDGQILAAIRNMWLFLQANPQLMAWVMQLLASLLHPAPSPTPAPIQV